MPNIHKAVLAIVLAAVPGIAHAGTSTATGTATLNVVNQCSVTGATVNLGTYTASNTIADVAAQTGGYYENNTFRTGNLGVEYANWGSVTCDSGTPYTLAIQGSNPDSFGAGLIQFAWKDASGVDKKVTFHTAIKKIGGANVPDNWAPWAGIGAITSLPGILGPVSGVGSGAAQTLLGSAIYDWTTSYQASTENLKVGTYTDTLTYTLNF